MALIKASKKPVQKTQEIKEAASEHLKEETKSSEHTDLLSSEEVTNKKDNESSENPNTSAPEEVENLDDTKATEQTQEINLQESNSLPQKKKSDQDCQDFISNCSSCWEDKKLQNGFVCAEALEDLCNDNVWLSGCSTFVDAYNTQNN
ncbi:MAG: hypothetical protein AABY27_02140 [Pseudomonadota bacterium]